MWRCQYRSTYTNSQLKSKASILNSELWLTFFVNSKEQYSNTQYYLEIYENGTQLSKHKLQILQNTEFYNPASTLDKKKHHFTYLVSSVSFASVSMPRSVATQDVHLKKHVIAAMVAAQAVTAATKTGGESPVCATINCFNLSFFGKLSFKNSKRSIWITYFSIDFFYAKENSMKCLCELWCYVWFKVYIH